MHKYAGIFCHSWRTSKPTGYGLVGSAVCVMLLVVGLWGDVVHTGPVWANTFFLSIWLLHGLFQSTGKASHTPLFMLGRCAPTRLP